MVPALITFAVIPFGPSVHMFGRDIPLYITDVNVGLLYIVSVASIGVYGIILGGWASNSKFPLLASLRASAQLISYEVAVTMTLVSLIMTAGSLSMVKIVESQYNSNLWFIFVQPVAFVLFFIGGLAETNRAPFDMAEAEQELTGGFHTEYSGMRFALFFLAEYANMIVVSAVATTLFLGGWLAPFPNVECAELSRVHSGVDLVPAEDVRLPVHLPVGARHAAALPVRPADAAGVEGADSRCHRQRHRDRHREGAVLMGNAIAFYVISAFILGFALLVVTTKNTVHAVLFLVLNFLAIAALYVLLTAQFLAVIQVLVYAGGIVVLYLFVVMLVNLKRQPEDHSAPQRQPWLGICGVGRRARAARRHSRAGAAAALPVDPHTMQNTDLAVNNVERIGMLLYTDYLIPFEVASMLLLVAMVGAIILAKREL